MIFNIMSGIQLLPYKCTDQCHECERNSQPHHHDRGVKLVATQESQVTFHFVALSVGLSTKTAIFMDKCVFLSVLSMFWPVFMDKCVSMSFLSMKMAVLVDGNNKGVPIPSSAPRQGWCGLRGGSARGRMRGRRRGGQRLQLYISTGFAVSCTRMSPDNVL